MNMIMIWILNLGVPEMEARLAQVLRNKNGYRTFSHLLEVLWYFPSCSWNVKHFQCTSLPRNGFTFFPLNRLELEVAIDKSSKRKKSLR